MVLLGRLFSESSMQRCHDPASHFAIGGGNLWTAREQASVHFGASGVLLNVLRAWERCGAFDDAFVMRHSHRFVQRCGVGRQLGAERARSDEFAATKLWPRE